jgi:N-acetylmuramoyl-L-alanine amidase CwlA
MTKVIFTVEAESEYDLRVYTQATAMAHSIWEFDQYLRSEYKYNDNLTEAEYSIYEKMREKLREILNENDVKIEL